MRNQPVGGQQNCHVWRISEDLRVDIGRKGHDFATEEVMPTPITLWQCVKQMMSTTNPAIVITARKQFDSIV